MQDPWTLYWQADRLDSADAVQSSNDYEPIQAWWAELAAALGDTSSVLDLATGNGTVPKALLETNPTLGIVAVDRADIDPVRFLSDPGALSGVTFQGGIDVTALPYDPESFDAITSQFGIEYAPLRQAVTEALRVLRTGGVLQFLMHSDDSEIVQPAHARRQEMQALLADNGVLMKLNNFLAGTESLEALESTGQAYLASGIEQTAGISGQIFSGINQSIGLAQQGDSKAAAELCETMLLRLAADHDRLRALGNAAMDKETFYDTVAALEGAGVVTDVAEPLTASPESGNGFVIGWRYRGRRS